MSRIDEHEKAITAIVVALTQARAAMKILNAAEPLGQTTRVVNPRARLLTSLGEAIGALDGCTDEYANMLEAAAIEADLNK